MPCCFVIYESKFETNDCAIHVTYLTYVSEFVRFVKSRSWHVLKISVMKLSGTHYMRYRQVYLLCLKLKWQQRLWVFGTIDVSKPGAIDCCDIFVIYIYIYIYRQLTLFGFVNKETTLHTCSYFFVLIFQFKEVFIPFFYVVTICWCAHCG